MNHGLMNGMFWAGVLISAVPVLASIGIGLFIWRETQRENREQHSPAEEVSP